MLKQFVFLFLISSLAVTLYAQQSLQGSYPQDAQSQGTQSSGSSDCSDPLQADSSQCSGQNSQQSSPLMAPQSSTGSQGGYGAQSSNPNKTYTDNESFSRQASGQNERQQTAPVILPPEQLTEFQKFIASTTGQILPIFGANLFRSVPSTFAPLDMTPVPSDYVVGPGDELRIRVWGQVNFEVNVRVDRAGEIYLPQVGTVHVSGLPFSEIKGHLHSAIGRIYRNFDLTADMGQIRSIQVYVAGEARRPGVYTVSSLSTLVDTLFASGGPSVQGSLRHIELRRGSAVVTDFDLYDLLIHGDKSKDVKLQSDDVIFIPPVGPQVAVTGSVRNPAIYELRASESLGALLANAGGVTSVASEARISIERIENHHDRHAMEMAYDSSGLATSLADGDLVRVFSIVPMYRKTVILRGNIANPGRFAWHPGMRISDLIPDKESLITRNYWWKRAQLGLPAPEFEPIPNLDNLRQPVENHAVPLKAFPTESMNGSNQPGGQQTPYGNQQTPYGSQQTPYGGQQTPYGSQTPQTGSQPAQYGNQQSENLSAQQYAGSASLASAQRPPANRSFPSAQRTEVRPLAPEIDWDYAVIERLDPETLKTTLIPFDLGKLVLQHDGSQDLELQADDVVTIFSDSDIRVPIAHQTKTVTLDGEFAHAGVYTVQPGETLRDLVIRAGGLSPNAYLYGSEFTRESTRSLQQARIDEYVQSLWRGIQRDNLAMASSGTSSAQNLASSTTAQSSEQDLLASLRQIRATGRIVLRFAPDSSSADSIPAITMEDGDRFVVPPLPATVNVVGSVYDQNSFLYVSKARSGAYLKEAGGPDRNADRRHEFIIRADGEVVSRGAGKTIWDGDGFDKLAMNPGDTIIVPEKALKPSALQGVLNWSQMFSQFALGAAALTIIQ
jgi:protein involved in polysaccharide export with SLBB domain